jgi:ankyrin repeat protein
VNATEPTFGAVPLHKATYNGHAGIAALLAAEPGIDLDDQGPSNGYTPLHDALWHGFADCARVLVEAGARLDLEGHDGLTPAALAEAAFGADDRVTRLIREREAA